MGIPTQEPSTFATSLQRSLTKAAGRPITVQENEKHDRWIVLDGQTILTPGNWGWIAKRGLDKWLDGFYTGLSIDKEQS